MSKIKTSFFCNNCGYESAKWSGKCPSCNQWNTFVEEVVNKGNQKDDSWKTYHSEKRSVHAVRLDDVVINEEKRIVCNDAELNRVLGGGIVPGSIVLVAGEPGIGKSTLFLQNAVQLQNATVLYVSGEER